MTETLKFSSTNSSAFKMKIAIPKEVGLPIFLLSALYSKES